MDWLQLTILAVVQGIAEFLPISSSGHVVILSELMHVDEVGDLNIVLHAGTLGSILIVYWNRVVRLLSQDRRVIGLLAVGTVPAIVAGLAIKLLADELVESALVAGLMLPITGAMLLWVARRDGEDEYLTLSYRDALLIGCFQAFALLPGISRSGATIVAGLLLGLRREAAATFSFLLAIPAILAASGYQLLKLLTGDGLQTPLPMLAAGALIALLVGLLALSVLLRVINQGRLHWFAWWCIPVGIAVVVWQMAQAWPLIAAQ